MIEVLLLDGSALAASLIDPRRVLAPAELEYHGTFRAESRRREFLLGRLLLKAALTAGTGRRTHEFNKISTTVSAKGKPTVAGAEFSLSHDRDAVLLAIGDQAVGVDVESVQEFDDSMMRMCFSETERHKIGRASRPGRVATLLWCLKESAAKATGAGLLPELAGEHDGRGCFRRGGFLHVAGRDRAYAVCSPLPLPPIHITPALPRFGRIFAALRK